MSYTHPDAPPSLAVPAPAAARIVGVSLRHWRALDASGRVPRAIRLGRRALWSLDDLRAWVAAGSPPRDRWEALRTRSLGVR